MDIRSMERRDVVEVWRLVQQMDELDRNSPYVYFLLADFFSPSCTVAVDGDRLAGCAIGFCPPSQPDVLFVWQLTNDGVWGGKPRLQPWGGFNGRILRRGLRRMFR